jgi:hypothetical protein
MIQKPPSSSDKNILNPSLLTNSTLSSFSNDDINNKLLNDITISPPQEALNLKFK